MGVEAAFSSVYHPQSNCAEEKASTLIFSAIKKNIGGPVEGQVGRGIAEGSMEP
jgi:hypothetical protein